MFVYTVERSVVLISIRYELILETQKWWKGGVTFTQAEGAL